MPPYYSYLVEPMAEIDSFSANVFSAAMGTDEIATALRHTFPTVAGNLLFYTNGCWIAKCWMNTMAEWRRIKPDLIPGQPGSYCSFGFQNHLRKCYSCLPFPDSVGK